MVLPAQKRSVHVGEARQRLGELVVDALFLFGDSGRGVEGGAGLEGSLVHLRDPARLVDQPAREPVVCQNSADRLTGSPFVVVEDPAQPFIAHDG